MITTKSLSQAQVGDIITVIPYYQDPYQVTITAVSKTTITTITGDTKNTWMIRDGHERGSVSSRATYVSFWTADRLSLILEQNKADRYRRTMLNEINKTAWSPYSNDQLERIVLLIQQLDQENKAKEATDV